MIELQRLQIFRAQEFIYFDNSYLIYHRMLSKTSRSIVKLQHYMQFVIYRINHVKITLIDKMHMGNIVLVGRCWMICLH